VKRNQPQTNKIVAIPFEEWDWQRINQANRKLTELLHKQAVKELCDYDMDDLSYLRLFVHVVTSNPSQKQIQEP